MRVTDLDTSSQPVPYCGPAPVPETLWTEWNFDPFLIIPALVIGPLLWLRCRDQAGNPAARPALGTAYLILFVAFISPLCALASALFSARIGHHILLISFAAPLFALAFPARRSAAGTLTVSTIFHAACVWLWHLPVPYSLALSSDAMYWLMELSLLGSAIWLWRGILYHSLTSHAPAPGAVLSAIGGTMMQMGFLGALLTFANRPLFHEHFDTTQAYGLTPLADQQLSGLLMWVPGALPYIVIGVFLTHRLVARHETS